MQSFLHGFHSYRLISWNKIIGVQPTHPGSRVSAYQTPARLDAAAVIDDSIVEVDEQCPRRIHSFGPLETTICPPNTAEVGSASLGLDGKAGASPVPTECTGLYDRIPSDHLRVLYTANRNLNEKVLDFVPVGWA